MTRLTRHLVAAVALLALSFAACGGGSSAGTVPTFTSTPDTGEGPTTATTASGAATTTTGPVSAAVTVSMITGGSAGFQFSPATATVASGGTVTWTNDSAAAHTIVFDDPSIASQKNLVNQGEKYATAFPKAGQYVYNCTVHPGMKGTVAVR